MVLHSLLEYTQELNEASAALSEREVHDLDQEKHELTWNLGEENSSLITQGLQNRSRKAKC